MDETLTVGKKTEEELKHEAVKQSITKKVLAYSLTGKDWDVKRIAIPIGSKINYIGDLPQEGKGHIRIIDELGKKHVIYVDRKDIEDIEDVKN